MSEQITKMVFRAQGIVALYAGDKLVAEVDELDPRVDFLLVAKVPYEDCDCEECRRGGMFSNG